MGIKERQGYWAHLGSNPGEQAPTKGKPKGNHVLLTGIVSSHPALAGGPVTTAPGGWPFDRQRWAGHRPSFKKTKARGHP